MHCGVSAVVLLAGPCSSLCCLCHSSCLCHAGSPALKQQLRADVSGLKPRVQANFVRSTAATPGTASADAPAFASQGSAAFYALCSQYCDIAHTCLPYPTAPHVLAPEEDSALLHMAQHLVARMDTVRRNNERIKSEEVQPGALLFVFFHSCVASTVRVLPTTAAGCDHASPCCLPAWGLWQQLYFG